MGPPSDFELHSVRTVTNDAPRRQTGLAKDEKLLRYHERSIRIFAFYFPLLVLPWIFTAILMFRPINLHAYIDKTGRYTPTDVANLERLRVAVDVLTRIAATLGIPLVSALLAHGAVVYTQRRRPGQHLSLLQLFTLADRQWLDASHIKQSLIALPNSWNRSSTYLRLAASLILITAIQPPLQSLLVRDETIPIVVCMDYPWANGMAPSACDSSHLHTWIVGKDAEPGTLSQSPRNLIVQRTSEKIISVDREDTQQFLWSDSPYRGSGSTHDRRNFEWALSPVEPEHLFFASSVPNGTSTGIFRQHAARMDSKVKCTKGRSTPSCKGTNPFRASLSLPYLNAEVCVDGRHDVNPWTRSRDKQEINETLWFRVSSWHPNSYYGSENFTIQCESVSRRGWFELPNHHNGYEPGPLLDVWPSKEELARDFNDKLYDSVENPTPPDQDDFQLGVRKDNLPDPFNTNFLPTPGPLMIAGLAMFGNTSFFHLAMTAAEESSNQTAHQICEQVRLPFSRLRSSGFPIPTEMCDNLSVQNRWNYELLESLGRYFMFLGSDNTTQDALNIGMYFANEALLTTAAARELYSNPGHMVSKPKKSLVALVVITILVGLQAIGLCLLMAFIYSTPTWTDDLDADALTQIGAQLEDSGQDLSDPSQICGLVGTVENRGNDESSSVRASSTDEGPVQVRRPFHLSLGGEGIISSELVKKGSGGAR
ncbi:hypothetical protein N0V84_007217 [Fusarium piperis]|uniref:Uncharacterized protein n=1 Tax=Fusarium piperis TaxID=1435070 RepID=A0A9W8WAL2_9HYPO|nr:hypothetical protein N0V84_007217 [Fusarium piperis]